MADLERTITSLTEVTTANNGDFLAMDTPDGTRKIQRNNLIPARGAFSLSTTDNVDLLNTRMWILDATDGKPREISVRDIVFGNFKNREETANFTLTPGIHNIRAVQIQDSVSTITLNGNTTGIGGCDFLIVNFRSVAVSVVASSISMFVDGVISDGTISARRAATISVNDAGTEAILSGG
ncbi:MAG: hypothetical protein R3F54_28665 [Alphaproteobacteria bacterium]